MGDESEVVSAIGHVAISSSEFLFIFVKEGAMNKDVQDLQDEELNQI